MTEDLLAIASDLARLADAPPPTAITPMEGGRNNRVFRTEHADLPRIMKLYHRDPRDPRDRLGHEWAFLHYAAQQRTTALPRPLARADDRRAALLSFAPGARIGADDVGAHLDKALAFLLAVNAQPRRFEGLPLASEACFSVGEHLATVDRRVARLAGLDPSAPLRDQVEHLVRRRLAPAWTRLRREFEGAPDLDDRLPARANILSPSDFGFHNALVDGDKVTFIDFEYAGLDDPAKLVGDTFAQPDVPAPPGAFASFARDLVAGLGLEEDHLERCLRLRPVYQLKWACIMLNEFLPGDAERRAAAGLVRTEESCARQLARIHAKLDDLEALLEP